MLLLLHLKVFESFLFRENAKEIIYFGLYESFLRLKITKILFMRGKFSLLDVHLQFDVPKFIFVSKNNSLKF